jgi:hypothetical protein
LDGCSWTEIKWLLMEGEINSYQYKEEKNRQIPSSMRITCQATGKKECKLTHLVGVSIVMIVAVVQLSMHDIVFSLITLWHSRSFFENLCSLQAINILHQTFIYLLLLFSFWVWYPMIWLVGVFLSTFLLQSPM